MHAASQLAGLQIARRSGIVQQAQLAPVAVELVREPVRRKSEGQRQAACEPSRQVLDSQEIGLHGRLEGGQCARPQVGGEVRVGKLVRMVRVVRTVEGPHREDLLEVRRRVAAVHAGQRLLAVGDVAAILLVVRSPDRHLRCHRQVEEGSAGVVQRPLHTFGDAVMADHEEADLAADVVELAGGAGDHRRVGALEAPQVKDRDSLHGHGASLVDGANHSVPASCHDMPFQSRPERENALQGPARSRTAARPAMRPNTAPETRPVPPG